MRAARVFPAARIKGVVDGGGRGLLGGEQAHAVLLQDAVIQEGLRLRFKTQGGGPQLAAHLLLGQEQGAPLPGQDHGLAIALQVLPGKGQALRQRLALPVQVHPHRFIFQVQHLAQVLGNGPKIAHRNSISLKWFRFLATS